MLLARLALLAFACCSSINAFSVSSPQLRFSGNGARASASSSRASHRSSPAISLVKMNVDSVERMLTEEQKGGPYKDVYAPYISLFDNPGCPRINTEYKGKMSGTLDDEVVLHL